MSHIELVNHAVDRTGRPASPGLCQVIRYSAIHSSFPVHIGYSGNSTRANRIGRLQSAHLIEVRPSAIQEDDVLAVDVELTPKGERIAAVQ
ncbi:hypothetical protein [Streptomyces sp. NPDC050848]|uniref:hypothetical protein n=1 Tax=Streptomyces sp. NPDC050848 TaxID=3155791 RepID=UPI0033E195B5